VATWFRTRYGEPTVAQRLAWPRIAAGEHLLLTAPTGSGKTLAAFLWALDRLLTGAWPGGTVRVLYVSPLKALNTDIRRNLLDPLAELRTALERTADTARPTAPAARLPTPVPGPLPPQPERSPYPKSRC
jgi:ATP-dependent Lhr-like helicase